MTRVKTSRGELEGVPVGGVTAFRGVPYAQPPTGERRFLAPQPAARWSGVRDASVVGAAPPQNVDGMSLELGLIGEDSDFSEDCLYLNVWTPDPSGPPRPVMVWIPGGAFMSGTGGSPAYDGVRLAERGDVVVVTVTYRVGFLGFGSLAGLPIGERGVTENRGLLDQVAALRWVREEIGSFGGDPAHVTVFGESAGAGSICALLAMPEARGLFERTIIQSAAPDGFIQQGDAAVRTAKVLDKLGVAAEDAGQLWELPVERLVEAQGAAAAEGPYTAGMFFVPVVDGDTLPEMPLAAVDGGRAIDVPAVIGTTRDEMQLYAVAMDTGSMPADRVERIAGRRAPGTAADGQPNGEALLEAYRAAREARGEAASPPDLYHALESDYRIRVPSIRLAEAHGRRQPETYMYLFDWVSPRHGGQLGSCHALDIPFTFGTLDAPRMSEFAGNGPDARALSDCIIDAWSAFARAGSPAHEGTGPWDRYEPSRRATMMLGRKCGQVDQPREPERAIWDAVAPE